MSSGPPGNDSGRLAAMLRTPWYPYVAAIYPLWFLYLSNLGQVPAISAIDATVTMLLIVAVLMWVATMVWRSSLIAALVVTTLVASFYAYGPAHDGVVRLAANTLMPPWVTSSAEALIPHPNLTLVLLAICALVILLIVWRVARDSTRLTGACNVAAATLAFILLVRVLSGLVEHHGAARDPQNESGLKLSVLGYNPDIYYIILDGYARADVLRDYYQFDNSPFIAELAKRGFSVNDASQANYNWTFLSLASSLNFDYLQDFAAPILADPEATRGRRGFGQVARAVQNNRAAHYLRARGYRFVHLLSSSPETSRNPFADEQVGCAGRIFDDEFFRALAEVSWLQALGGLATSDLAECHQLRLESLAQQARNPGPKFVFAHFLPPHHPYLFDRAGNVLQRVTISNQFDFQAHLWEDHAAYLEQLRYVNRTMLEVIDRIVADSERPPVIIVQSDHGPNLLEGLTTEQAQHVRLANFAAYLLPGTSIPVMPHDCAPVNQFRYLFNHYFEAGMPILPNKSYFSGFRTPLRMREVGSEPHSEESP